MGAGEDEFLPIFVFLDTRLLPKIQIRPDYEALLESFLATDNCLDIRCCFDDTIRTRALVLRR